MTSFYISPSPLSIFFIESPNFWRLCQSCGKIFSRLTKKHPSHGCEGCFGEIFLLRLSGVLGDILGGIIGDVVKVLIADIHVQRRLLEEDVIHQGHNVQGHQGGISQAKDDDDGHTAHQLAGHIA